MRKRFGILAVIAILIVIGLGACTRKNDAHPEENVSVEVPQTAVEVKPPKVEVDEPEVEVTVEEPKVEVETEVPEVEVETPEIDVETPEIKQETTQQDASAGQEVSVAYRFRSKKLLNQHYEKHGKDMGFASATDYEAAASAVINNPEALYKTEKEDGDGIYYVESTNEFVVLSTDGYIRTYFLPDAGKRYFDKQ